MTTNIITEISNNPRIVKVKIKNPKIKVPIPAAIQIGNGGNADWIQPDRPGIRLQVKDFLVVAGSIVLLFAFLAMGYLRLVKGVDIFKPARNRIATASCVLFHQGDYVLVERDDLNYLVSNSEKLAKLLQQKPAVIQTDNLATGDSGI